MSQSLFVIEIHYTGTIDEIDASLSAHRDFLQRYYDRRLLLASGPKVPRDGGIIIACMQDRQAVEAFIEQDPFYQEKIAQYQIIEFDPVKSDKVLASLID